MYEERIRFTLSPFTDAVKCKHLRQIDGCQQKDANLFTWFRLADD